MFKQNIMTSSLVMIKGIIFHWTENYFIFHQFTRQRHIMYNLFSQNIINDMKMI